MARAKTREGRIQRTLWLQRSSSGSLLYSSSWSPMLDHEGVFPIFVKSKDDAGPLFSKLAGRGSSVSRHYKEEGGDDAPSSTLQHPLDLLNVGCDCPMDRGLFRRTDVEFSRRPLLNDEWTWPCKYLLFRLQTMVWCKERWSLTRAPKSEVLLTSGLRLPLPLWLPATGRQPGRPGKH
jgi:hypothetical protein